MPRMPVMHGAARVPGCLVLVFCMTHGHGSKAPMSWVVVLYSGAKEGGRPLTSSALTGFWVGHAWQKNATAATAPIALPPKQTIFLTTEKWKWALFNYYA